MKFSRIVGTAVILFCFILPGISNFIPLPIIGTAKAFATPNYQYYDIAEFTGYQANVICAAVVRPADITFTKGYYYVFAPDRLGANGLSSPNITLTMEDTYNNWEIYTFEIMTTGTYNFQYTVLVNEHVQAYTTTSGWATVFFTLFQSYYDWVIVLGESGQEREFHVMFYQAYNISSIYHPDMSNEIKNNIDLGYIRSYTTIMSGYENAKWFNGSFDAKWPAGSIDLLFTTQIAPSNASYWVYWAGNQTPIQPRNIWTSGGKYFLRYNLGYLLANPYYSAATSFNITINNSLNPYPLKSFTFVDYYLAAYNPSYGSKFVQRWMRNCSENTFITWLGEAVGAIAPEAYNEGELAQPIIYFSENLYGGVDFAWVGDEYYPVLQSQMLKYNYVFGGTDTYANQITDLDSFSTAGVPYFLGMKRVGVTKGTPFPIIIARENGWYSYPADFSDYHGYFYSSGTIRPYGVHISDFYLATDEMFFFYGSELAGGKLYKMPGFIGATDWDINAVHSSCWDSATEIVVPTDITSNNDTIFLCGGNNYKWIEGYNRENGAQIYNFSLECTAMRAINNTHLLCGNDTHIYMLNIQTGVAEQSYIKFPNIARILYDGIQYAYIEYQSISFGGWRIAKINIDNLNATRIEMNYTFDVANTIYDITLSRDKNYLYVADLNRLLKFQLFTTNATAYGYHWWEPTTSGPLVEGGLNVTIGGPMFNFIVSLADMIGISTEGAGFFMSGIIIMVFIIIGLVLGVSSGFLYVFLSVCGSLLCYALGFMPLWIMFLFGLVGAGLLVFGLRGGGSVGEE